MKMLPMRVICDEVWPCYFLMGVETFPSNCQIPEELYEEYKRVKAEYDRFQDILKAYYQNAEDYENDD